MKKLVIFSKILILGMLFLATLFGCASGTALVTGTQRAATNADEVVIYTEAPEEYEVIGIVTASSDAGWTEQGDLNYAVAELKKQAAKIGANDIILESVSTINSGNPAFSTVFKILNAIGYTLTPTPLAKQSPA